MRKLSDHSFDNLEHGRGRRVSTKKTTAPDKKSFVPRTRDKRHRNRPFPHITLAVALKKALATPALRRRFSVLTILSQWENIVGETAAQHVQPAALEKGTLVLQCDSSVWRQQVSMMGPEILGKVQEYCAEESVKTIKVK